MSKLSLKFVIAILICYCYINSDCLFSSAESSGLECGKLEFRCHDGKCINKKWRCDGSYDCPDRSDESYCQCRTQHYMRGRYQYSHCTCPPGYFNCSSDCIPNSWTCDGSTDCKDGSDESFDLCVQIRPCTAEEFKCANKKCVNKSLLCDGTNDCMDYSDESCWSSLGRLSGHSFQLGNITSFFNVTETKDMWGEETPRAFLALYFADKELFSFNNSRHTKAIKKQLELLIALSLLKNDTEALAPTKMAVYIQSLLATCLNPTNFHGYDLIEIVNSFTRNISTSQISPTVALALCNAGQEISKNYLDSIRGHLNSTEDNPIQLDTKAQALLVLECLKRRNVDNIIQDSIIQKTVNEIKSTQKADGSVVNLYTTALFVQAMIATKDNGENWNFTKAVKYIMSKQNTDGSFDGNIANTYVVAPVLAGKTFLDIPRQNCGERFIDVKEKLGEKFHIKYSLWIGDYKDVMHTIELRIADQNTLFDVMSIAEIEDLNYKMESVAFRNSIYIHSINKIHNDPEHMMYWRLYQMKNNTLHKITQNIDTMFPLTDDHFVMWYSSTDA